MSETPMIDKMLDNYYKLIKDAKQELISEIVKKLQEIVYDVYIRFEADDLIRIPKYKWDGLIEEYEERLK